MTRRQILFCITLAALVLLFQLPPWWMKHKTPVPSWENAWGQIRFACRLVSFLLLFAGLFYWTRIRRRLPAHKRHWQLTVILPPVILFLFVIVSTAGSAYHSGGLAFFEGEFVNKGTVHYDDGTELYLRHYVSGIPAGDDYTRDYSLWKRDGAWPVMVYEKATQAGNDSAVLNGKTYRFTISEKGFETVFVKR